MSRKRRSEVISFRTRIQSPFGILNIVWEEQDKRSLVTQILIPNVKLTDHVKNIIHYVEPNRINSKSISKLIEHIQAFLSGNDVIFDLGMIALDRCTDFQRRVLIAEYNIPRGRVSTYGRIAAHLGHPRASRAVGRVLATHPFPIVIPCHRAVQSDGRLGGYQGGLDMKRKLLKMEGVRVSTRGKVETDVFYY